MTTMRREANKLGRHSSKHKDNITHPIHEQHAAASKLFERTLERTKRQHWRDWLERAVDPDIWTVHKVTSASPTDGAKARIPVLKHRLGESEVMATTNAEKSKALAKSFFPTKPDDAGIPVDFAYPKACCKPDQITKEQIAHQIRKLKPYKAPGPDGIPNIVLMRCSDLVTDRLYFIYKAMVERNLHYGPWKISTTVVLRKPGKPRYDVPKAYRPIALLNTMWKVLAGMIADQLTFYSEKYNLLPPNHFSGRPGRTTSDALLLVTHKIKNAWSNVTSILFLDVEGAFPNAMPARLAHNLRKRRIPLRYVNFVASMLENRTTLLKFDDHVSEALTLDNGIGQGDPLSMVLYQYYNADILEVPQGKNEAAIAYVDDVLILASAKDFTETHEILADMMTREGGIYQWTKTHNSPIEHSKLALIDFAHRNNKKDRPNLELPDSSIKPTTSAKYLGVMLDQHLDWKAQQAHAVEKGSKWAAQIKRVTNSSWGITPRYARRLYIGVALPRILYGAEVWCGPVKGTCNAQEGKGMARVVRQLTTIQRSGAIAITGALRTSPTDTLDACAFLLLAKHLLNSWCHRSSIRLASLPPEHPLFQPANQAKSKYIKRHKSPLHALFNQTSYDPKSVEKIPSKPRNPALIGSLPFDISIPTSKEASILEDKYAEEEVRIYSDGSAHDGKVGASAVLIRADQPNKSLHFHLGPETVHTVHEAELIGTLLALHLIKNEKNKNTSFAIGTDNHAALEAFHSDLRSPAHSIARESLRVGNMLRKQVKGKRFSLTLRWTAGHVGIPGNEIADREAKRAAGGLQSDKECLPPFLRRNLALNPSAIKQQHNDNTKAKWTKTWRKSPRGRNLAKIDKSTPSAKFLGAISSAEISRRSASLITQLLIEHIPLNSYLEKFKKVDNARCPACGETRESVSHFLLHCPGYAHERWILDQRVRKKNKSLSKESLLGTPELIKPLANFIKASHRFK